MFIDETFFTGDKFIPNLNEKHFNMHFFEWLEQFEEECLRITLGDKTYTDLLDVMIWNEDEQKYTLNPNAEEKWEWLLYGHSYVKDNLTNQTINFQGGNIAQIGFNSLFVSSTITETLNAGQTEITINSSYPSVYLYKNSVWQVLGLDFTYLNGKITLLQPVIDNDYFEIVPLISHASGLSPQGTTLVRWDGIIKIVNRRIRETVINGNTANGIIISNSYLAYYIYWRWSLNSETATTGTGEKSLQSKGATVESNLNKRINAYNKFVSMVAGCNGNGTVSLYTFVQDFGNLYPDWSGSTLNYETLI